MPPRNRQTDAAERFQTSNPQLEGTAAAVMSVTLHAGELTPGRYAARILSTANSVRRMGAAYLAAAPVQQRRADIKVMQIAAANQGALERFELNQRVLALLSHPNIGILSEARATLGSLCGISRWSTSDGRPIDVKHINARTLSSVTDDCP